MIRGIEDTCIVLVLDAFQEVEEVNFHSLNTDLLFFPRDVVVTPEIVVLLVDLFTKKMGLSSFIVVLSCHVKLVRNRISFFLK